jgi:uncharacterized membrane protein YfcA
MDSSFPRAVAIGLVAGAFGGMFGVGGGVIAVPGLILWLGLDQYHAAGTSLAAIVASSAAALVAFAFDDAVDWGAAVVLFAGSGIGAWLGARYVTRVPQHVLVGTFSVLVAVAAVRLWL